MKYKMIPAEKNEEFCVQVMFYAFHHFYAYHFVENLPELQILPPFQNF